MDKATKKRKEICQPFFKLMFERFSFADTKGSIQLSEIEYLILLPWGYINGMLGSTMIKWRGR